MIEGSSRVDFNGTIFLFFSKFSMTAGPMYDARMNLKSGSGMFAGDCPGEPSVSSYPPVRVGAATHEIQRTWGNASQSSGGIELENDLSRCRCTTHLCLRTLARTEQYSESEL